MRTFGISTVPALFLAYFLSFCWIQLAIAGRPSSETDETPKERKHDQQLPRITIPGASKQGINDSKGSDNALRDDDKEHSSSFSAVRALATYAPDVAGGIYQSGVGRVGGGGIELHQRFIHDWEVEDYVLMSTVDGTLYATDRKTGATRWEIFTSDPMVQTTSHRANISNPAMDWIPDDNLIWIVEPTDGGQLFYFSPESGLKRFGISVKGIVDATPFSTKGSDKIYNGDKKTTTFAIDARGGKVQRIFSSSGLAVMNNKKCKPHRALEVEELDDECNSAEKIILIGRTEYTVTISNFNTGEKLWTIKYTEWGPNNSDRDLAEQHRVPMDNRYIYSSYNGGIYGFEGNPTGLSTERTPKYRRDLSSPVTRIFDVVKSVANTGDTDTESFVVLPQPAVVPKDIPRDEKLTFVGLTDSGHYALSEASYPFVTDGAHRAACYSKRIDWQYINYQERQKVLVGTHSAHYGYQEPHPASLPARSQNDDEKPVMSKSTSPPLPSSPSLGGSKLLGLAVNNPVDLSIVIFLFFVVVWAVRGPRKGVWFGFRNNSQGFNPQEEGIKEIIIPGDDIVPVKQDVKEQVPLPEEGDTDPVPATIGEPVIAAVGETRAMAEEKPTITAEEIKAREVRFNPQPEEINDGAGASEILEIIIPVPPATPKKKKAHRGQRGGKKRGKGNINADKEEGDRIDRIVNDAKKVEQELPLQPDMTDRSSANDVETSLVSINGLDVYEDQILGRGSQGTTVCKGSFDGREVAVKRMLNDFVEIAEHEVKLLQQSDDHPNVIRYYCKQKGGKFLYIALELCKASLNDVMIDQQTFQELSEALDATEILYQIAAGVHHLHSLKIVHRDLKPQNILVSYPKAQRNAPKGAPKKPRLLISDFGLCKTLDDNQSSFKLTTHASPGTCGWRAPELLTLEEEGRPPFASPGNTESSGSGSSDTIIIDTATAVQRRATRAIDIFSMGCVFYFILSQGEHPFGDKWHRELNIIHDSHDLSKLDMLGDAGYEAKDLIRSMIDHNPKKRPDATKVMIHPFFWSPEKRLHFLLDVSDRFEVEKDKEKDPNYKSPWIPHLEHGVSKIIKKDWLKQLDRGFLEELLGNKRRGYDGEKVLDLLRAIRNKKHHYQDMKPAAKASVGALPGPYLCYFTRRFPDLLLHAYHVIRETGFSEEPVFHTYYTTAASTL